MRIFIVGGTGFIGYHATLEFLKNGHSVSTISIPDVELGEYFPKEVEVKYGNIFTMESDELINIFEGFDVMVYAVGPDDRVDVKGSAYEYFHDKLVTGCGKVVAAAREAGIKKTIVLNSYFAYFDRIWPDKKLAERHPYIKCRVEQADRAILEGKDGMDVMILELPYIFGVMPGRVPLWKNILVKRMQGKLRFFPFPKGGTTIITVQKVAEAILGAALHGKGGMRYPIGDQNMSWKKMLTLMLKSLGLNKKVISIPKFIANLYGKKMRRDERKQGIEKGLKSEFLFQDIQTQYMFFDPLPTAKALKFTLGGVEQAIKETMKACL